FGGLGGYTNKDAGGKRTRDINAVVASKPRANFGNRDELSFLRFSNQRIDIQRLGYEHRAGTQPLRHARWNVGYLGVILLHEFISPGFAGFQSLGHRAQPHSMLFTKSGLVCFRSLAPVPARLVARRSNAPHGLPAPTLCNYAKPRTRR